VAGSCEHGNETSVFIKGEKVFNQMQDYKRFKDYTIGLVSNIRLVSKKNGSTVINNRPTLFVYSVL
jgi:hypothetical protein